MMSLFGGIVALVLGIIGLIFWWDYFIDILQGTLPILFILGGALATYLGLEELKDKSSDENYNDQTSELKSEVENLKEEIKGLKEEQKTKGEKIQ
jgi:hypothetical protein